MDRGQRNRWAAAIGLTVLVIQNSSSLMLQHKLQARTEANTPRYDPLTVVVLSETLKISICSIGVLGFSRESSAKAVLNHLHHGHAKAAVPAVLYTLAAAAQSIGAYNLDMISFLVLSQLKFILTPIFGLMLLRQKLSAYQWTCLFVMASGIVLVQTGSTAESLSSPTTQTLLLGAAAMLVASLCVSFSGVYMEAMMKASDTFLVRNLQLSAYSCVFAIVGFSLRSASGFSDFFRGYHELVWLLVVLQAAGSFIVAWCIRVASSVEKNYAQALGFLVASLFPLLTSSRTGSFRYYIGVFFVLAGVFGSLWKDKPQEALGHTNEKTPKDYLPP